MVAPSEIKIVSRAQQLYTQHKKWVPVVSFLLGFTFDAIVLTRIDEPKVILQQAIYILVSAFLIGVELIEEDHLVTPHKLLNWPWKYREFVLHFLLGTLLNSYTIFYFKSASELTTFIFIGLLIILLTLNEFKHFGKSETQIHIGLLSLSVISYLVSLSPTLLGFMGVIPFVCAVATSVLFFYCYYSILKPRLTARPRLLQTHLVYPYVGILLGFVTLYFIRVIPPVPLSVKFMGIYHTAKRDGQKFELGYTRSRWLFWQNGDQTFMARPGDAIYCFAQIFSPTRFKDQLQIRWLYWENGKGWRSSDAIPMPVSGGREEGYRAVTRKGNFQPGPWRVQVETADSQVVGRIDFKVVADESLEERNFTQIER